MKAAVLHTISYKFTSSMIIVQLLGTNQKIPCAKSHHGLRIQSTPHILV